MVAPASWRRRLLHSALTAGLACPLMPAFGGTPAASSSSPSAPAYVARGIGVLAPVQPIPVRPAPSMASRAVPLDPTPCDLQISEPAMDTSVAGGGAEAIPGTGSTLSGDAATGPLACDDTQAATAPTDAPSYSFDLESGDIPRVPVVVISGVSRPSRPWFASVSGQDGLRYGGDRNWIYRNTGGPSFAVGNISANAPTWGSSAPVGGLQISNLQSTTAPLAEGTFGYSSSLGRLNRMDPSATSGAVDYGASVGNSTVRYGLTPVLTLAIGISTEMRESSGLAGSPHRMKTSQPKRSAASVCRPRSCKSSWRADSKSVGWTDMAGIGVVKIDPHHAQAPHAQPQGVFPVPAGGM